MTPRERRLEVPTYLARLHSIHGEIQRWVSFPTEKRRGDAVAVEGVEPAAWRVASVIPEISGSFDGTLVCRPGIGQ